VHNTSEVLFRLCANTDPPSPRLRQGKPATRQPLHQRPVRRARPRLPAGRQATSEIASGSKLGIDATKKLPGEGFKRPWPPLIKMDAAVNRGEGEGGKTLWLPLDFAEIA
jgi:4-hydroxy-3-polyprenylbenzoate decarboxylase